MKGSLVYELFRGDYATRESTVMRESDKNSGTKKRKECKLDW